MTGTTVAQTPNAPWRRRCRDGAIAAAALALAVLSAAPAAARHDGRILSPPHDLGPNLGTVAARTVADAGTGAGGRVGARAELEAGLWAFGVAVPRIGFASPGGVAMPGTRIGSKLAAEASAAEFVAAATYRVFPSLRSLPSIRLSGRVEVPGGNAAATGEDAATDYIGRIEISETYDRLTPFAALGYRFAESAEAPQIDEQFSLSIGAGFAFSPRAHGGLILDYRTAMAPDAEDPTELSPFVAWKPGVGWAVNLYGLVGLTEGSPNHGGGMNVTLTW